MKIQLRQSGGFAGLIRGAEIETSDLRPADARQVERLARQVVAASPSPSDRTRTDVTRYELSVEEGGKQQSSVFDDVTSSSAASKLVGLLQAHSRPLAPR